jgi:tape measure domain-containing protein
MAQNRREIELALQITTANAEALGKLRDDVKDLAKSSGDAAPEFKKLGDELGKLEAQARQLQVIDAFADDIQKASTAQKDAASTAQQYKAALDATQATLERARAAEKEKSAAIAKSASDLKLLEAGYLEHKATLGSTTKATEDYRKKATEARAAINEKKAEIKKLQSELIGLKGTTETAANAQKTANTAYKESATALKDASKALDGLQTQVDAANRKLIEAGGMSIKLGDAQSKLAADVTEAKKAIQAQITELDRLERAERDAAAQAERLAIIQLNTKKALQAQAKAEADGIIRDYQRMEQAQREAAQAAKEAGQRIQDAFGATGAKSVQELRAEIERVKSAMQLLASSGAATGRELDQAMRQGQSRINALEREIREATGSLTLMDRAAGALKTTLGQLAAFISLVEIVERTGRAFLTANANIEKMRLGLTSIYGSSATAEKQIRFLQETADRAGVSFNDISQAFIKFSASTKLSNIPLSQTNELFAELTRVGGVLGLSAYKVEAALEAVSQMAAKGVVNMEELRQQLGDALPGALSLTAKGLGVTTAELFKMVEQGQLTAKEFIPAFTKSLKEIEGQANTLTAKWQQLGNAVNKLFQNLGDAGVTDAIKTGLDKVTAAVRLLGDQIGNIAKILGYIDELLLLVLVKKTIPLAIAAFRSLGAAGVLAATSVRTAWTLATTSVTAATAAVGKLGMAFNVLAAFIAGWQIGTILSERFEVVRVAGVKMANAIAYAFEQMQYKYEAFLALFTSDTLDAAAERHKARLADMDRIFGEMMVEAKTGTAAVAEATDEAADAAAKAAEQLAAAKQAASETIATALTDVKEAAEATREEIEKIESAITKSEQTANAATTGIGSAYQSLTQMVADAATEQIQAIDRRYSAEKDALETNGATQKTIIEQGTRLLTASITEQLQARQDALTTTLRLINDEYEAIKVANTNANLSDDDRLRHARQIEDDMLEAKRSALQTALSEYQRHIDSLNAEANRHLKEIERIEEAKRQLSLSTDERIREIMRGGLTAYQANEDRKTQINEFQAKAREALSRGEFDVAKEFAQKAMNLASTVAQNGTSEAQKGARDRENLEKQVTRVLELEAQARTAAAKGESERASELFREAEKLRAEIAQKTKVADAEIASGKRNVAQGVNEIRESEGLLKAALEQTAESHKTAATAATSAANDTKNALGQVKSEITSIDEKLKENKKLTIEADTSKLKDALAEIKRLVEDKALLLRIEGDLQAAEAKLNEFAKMLAEGKTLPIDADISLAKDAINALKAYADQNTNTELKLATDKAQTAVAAVAKSITELGRLNTQTNHTVKDNVPAVRAEIKSLDGVNTSSTHTIYVKRVEVKATGGVVGAAVQAFAKGGPVRSAFRWMRGGKVPGIGNTDSVPRTLEEGAFVLRKAAVRKYGASAIESLSQGVNTVAGGGRKVLSMLMPGEIVVPKGTVQQYGAGFFEALNGLTAPAQTAPVAKFATGGAVGRQMAAQNMMLAQALQPIVINLNGSSTRINVGSPSDASALQSVLTQLANQSSRATI